MTRQRGFDLYRKGFAFYRNGFTLFELVVVIVITSVLAIILLNRFLYYQEIAEKTAMDMTVMNMRSGLRLRVAELMMQDRMNEAGQLLQENPITWLETLPLNYKGKMAGSKQTALIPGNWYFDTGRKELVYQVQHDRFFKSGEDSTTSKDSTIRFHVTAVKHSRQNGNGAVHKVEGVTLTSVTEYHWF